MIWIFKFPKFHLAVYPSTWWTVISNVWVSKAFFPLWPFLEVYNFYVKCLFCVILLLPIVLCLKITHLIDIWWDVKKMKNLWLQQKSHFHVLMALKWIITVNTWCKNLKAQAEIAKSDKFQLTTFLGKKFIASQICSQTTSWLMSIKNGMTHHF